MKNLLDTQQRDSNYDCLKLVSMFSIIIYHILLHGKLLSSTTGITNVILYFIFFLSIFHVSVLVLITGYYQVNKEFKIEKLIKLILEFWFYSIVINFILKYTGLVVYSKTNFVLNILPFNFETYWFLVYYLLLYIVSPYLNILINKIDIKTFKKMIIVLILCFSVIPYFTSFTSFNTSGYSLYHFILLYFLGAYFRKTDFINTHWKNNNNTQKRLILFSIFVICALCNLSFQFLLRYLFASPNGFVKWYIQNMHIEWYNNPFILLQSVAIFLYFGTLNFKNNIISKMASTTLAIYLITDNSSVRSIIYKLIGIDTGLEMGAKSILLTFGWGVVFFISCILIDFIRQFIFKYISRIKPVKSIGNKLKNFFENTIEVK